MSGWPRRAMFDGLIYIAIMVPGIVIGIATLIAFVTLFDVVNPLLAGSGRASRAAPRSMGLGSVIARACAVQHRAWSS